MDKAIIFGGYEFLGFYLSTALLEKGNTVQCVRFDNNDDSFLEEKRFTVGRNDNFSEIPLSKWVNSSLASNEKFLIVVSFYDLFLKNESDKIMSQIKASFERAFAKVDMENASFILILPIQYLESDDRAFLNICNLIEKTKLNYKCIYTPTLYGPWQPMENIFQQAFLYEVGEREKLHLSEKEWVFDTLFVSDAVDEIMNVIENDSIKTCILKSSVSDHWKKCAEYLSIPSSFFDAALSQRKMVTDIPYIKVIESIGYKQGLNLQKLHLLRILSGV